MKAGVTLDANSKLESIPENFKRIVVDCINMALKDDYSRYLDEFQPDTTNALPLLVGDWINTNISKHLTGENIETITFPRCGWRGKIIIAHEQKLTFSIIREKRIDQIKKEQRDNPHYLQTIFAVLNVDFVAPVKQMNFLDGFIPVFDTEMIESDYNGIFRGAISKDEGFNHCVIAYETDRGMLTDIGILFLDKDLDVVASISMKDYIRPDFAKLTAAENESDDTEPEEESSANLITLRANQETDENPIEVREDDNQQQQ